MLTETNQEYVTPKLITKLMYAFRDIQVGIYNFIFLLKIITMSLF